MRPVTLSFWAGVIAIAAVSAVEYCLTPAGDTHLGPSIYVLAAILYFISHVFGVGAAKLSTYGLEQLRSARALVFCISFLLILICNVGGFVLIYGAIFRYWVWEGSIWWLFPSLVVGVVAACAFVYASNRVARQKD